MNRKNQDHIVSYGVREFRTPPESRLYKLLNIVLAILTGVMILLIPVVLALWLSYKGWI